MHSAFYALFHHFTGRFVRFFDIPVKMIIVGAATARTDELCKAILALFTGKQTGIFKFFPYVLAFNARIHAAHFEVFIPRKLVAGINIAARRHRKIFVAGAACADTLCKTGAALQIDIEMEEVEALPLGVTL